MHGRQQEVTELNTTPLSRVRLTAKKTQKEVAAALGIDQGHYSRIERGEVQPSTELARRISEHFNGEPSVLEIIDPCPTLPVPTPEAA